MRRLLGGDESDELLRSLSAGPVTGLRVNTLKLTAHEFEMLSPWELKPVPWCPSGFLPLLEGEERPGRHPFHAAGLFYLQEPSAMAVAEALAPRRGELVLDLAAAPGGKSTHLASLLGHDGILVANDISAARARELSRNLERWGARRALVTNAAPSQLARTWGPLFDAVLLDAPCSGEGMFRKTPQAREQWTPELVTDCAVRQDSLLDEAARLVRPGGRLVYSTCTFEPEENEQVVARFLESRPDWELQPTGLEGVQRGRPEWAAGSVRSAELALAMRLWPHQASGEGHFLALLRRSERSSAGTAIEARSAAKVRSRGRGAGADEKDQAQALGLWRRFVNENLCADPLPRHALSLRSDGLYAVPTGAPALTGVKALRPGLWLGTVDRGRFAPSHALALALRIDDARRTVDLFPDDPRLHSYLLGMELDSPGEDGWVLVAVAGQPLGWGRRGRDIIKNHYPKGLRRRSAND